MVKTQFAAGEHPWAFLHNLWLAHRPVLHSGKLYRWWGTGLWYNKNSESVAEFVTVRPEFLKDAAISLGARPDLSLYYSIDKPTHMFDSPVLMRLTLLWNIYCCSHHLRPRNVPSVGNSTGRVGIRWDDSVCVGCSLSGLTSPCCCVQLHPLGVVAWARVFRDIVIPMNDHSCHWQSGRRYKPDFKEVWSHAVAF